MINHRLVLSKVGVQQVLTSKEEEYQMEIVWLHVFCFITFHCAAFYGFYLGFTIAKWATIAWGKLSFRILNAKHNKWP